MSVARALGRVHRAYAAFAACVLILTVDASAVAAEPAEVGTTLLAKKKVTGIIGVDERELKKDVRVFRNELVRTGPEAQAEFTAARQRDDYATAYIYAGQSVGLVRRVVPAAELVRRLMVDAEDVLKASMDGLIT